MGRFDKDRYQKELAVKFCLQLRLVPFAEVVVTSSADLSDSVEVLSDIDVLGLGQSYTEGAKRVLFDCKSGGKLSPIGRAFWAEGLRSFTGSDEAFVIMKSPAVHNHRISALQMGIDLHDDQSFISLGKTFDPAFPADTHYQSALSRWDVLEDAFRTNVWGDNLYDLIRNVVPLSKTPWTVFRRLIAELRAVRGEFDPAKPKHVAIFLDVMSSTFALWAEMGRDIRRIYQPKMAQAEFEMALRYYLWGGKEPYRIRQQIRESVSPDKAVGAVELPAWPYLLGFAGILIGAPQLILDCSIITKEVALREVTGSVAALDARLKLDLKGNPRSLQFALALTEYLVEASGLPKDMMRSVETALTAP